MHKRLERLVLEERGLDEIARDDLRRRRRRGAGARRARRAARRRAPSGASCRRGRRPRSRREVRAPRRRAARLRARPRVGRAAARWRCRSRARAAARRRPGWWSSRDSGGLGDFERLICQQAVAVVALELMRRRVAARHRAPPRRRRARRRRSPAASTPRSCAGRLRPFGIGEEAAVLVFELADPEAGRGDAASAAWPTPAARLSSRSTRRAAATAVAVVDATLRRPGGARRGRPPRARGGRAAVRAAASRAAGADALRRALPRGPLRARGGGAAPTATRPRWPPGATSAPSRCCCRCRTTTRCACTATACSARSRRATSEYGDELLRSLEAFIEHNGQWERAARELYCHRHTLRYRMRKRRGADRPRPGRAHDRIEFWLALRGTGAGHGEGRGARSRRHDRAGDRARPGRVRGGDASCCCSTSTATRAERVAERTAAARPSRAAADAREGLGEAARRTSTCSSTRPLPDQPRRDARLPRGGLPLHRPRRALPRDRASSSSCTTSSSGAGLLALLGMGSRRARRT